MIQQKDMKILVELRQNARAQLTTISKKTNIPISTIYDRLRNKSDNIVKKHVSLINFEKIGFSTQAQICIKSNKKCRYDLRDFLMKHQNVNSLYKINNGYDYMIEAVFRNVKDLEEFLEDLDERFTIKTKQVYYIIDDIVKEKFFSDPLHLELLSS